MLDRVNTSTPSLDASRLFQDAYSHLKPGIKFVQERPAESIAAGVVLVSAAAAAVALRGRGLSALGTAGEEALGKNLLGKSLLESRATGEKVLGGAARQVENALRKPLAEPVQYRSVAQEVEAFSRNLDDGLRRHDALAHVMTLKNPATYGGELRGAISESVAKQMLERPWKKPSFRDALSRYQSERDIQYDSYGWEAPPIPRATLKKWFDLSKRRMEENMRRWGRGLPEDSSYSVYQHLEVPRKWS
jgi:hypothetical protein